MHGNRARLSGNPRRIYLLSGLPVCPVCGNRMALTRKTYASGTRRYYVCSKYQNAVLCAGEKRCSPKSFAVEKIEDAVVRAIMDAVERPDVVRAARQAYKEPISRTELDPRAELVRLDDVLRELDDQEQALIRAQVAGIRAGASPNAYAAAFADLAGRRKDFEDRRGQLASIIRRPPTQANPSNKDFDLQVIADIDMALKSDLVPKEDRRRLIRTVVEKVVCREDGAEVYFGGETVQNISVTQNSPVWGLR